MENNAAFVERGQSEKDEVKKETDDASKPRGQWGAAKEILWTLFRGPPSNSVQNYNEATYTQTHAEEQTPLIWVIRDPYLEGTYLLGWDDQTPIVYITRKSPLWSKCSKFGEFKEDMRANHGPFMALDNVFEFQSNTFFNLVATYQSNDAGIINRLNTQVEYLKAQSVQDGGTITGGANNQNAPADQSTPVKPAVPLYDNPRPESQHIINRRTSQIDSAGNMTVEKHNDESDTQSDHENKRLDQDYYKPSFEIALPTGGRIINPTIWLIHLFNLFEQNNQ